jgi:hypothetical protein
MEREDDVAYLRALGCDYAQGFYFGEPMTEREVMNLLNALAKSSKRDERRERKKKKAEPAPAEIMEEEQSEEAMPPLLAPPEPAATHSPQSLPVPIPPPAPKRPVRKKPGIFASIKKSLGRATSASSKAASLGSSLKGALKPAKAKEGRSAQQRPPVPASPNSPGREAPSLRKRLNHMEPPAADGYAPPPLPPQPQPNPNPNPYGRSGQPPMPPVGAEVGADTDPDYDQTDWQRRRRG